MSGCVCLASNTMGGKDRDIPPLEQRQLSAGGRNEGVDP